MTIGNRRARVPGAGGTRHKLDDRTIRPCHWIAIVIALFISSCAAPDTRHQIVISTRDQKLALLDRGNLMATYPVSTSKLRSWRLARQQVYAARQIADSGKNWRQCATGHGVQESATHWRTRPCQFTRSRSDRDADSLVAWTGSAKCQRIWEGHLHPRHTRGMENRFARELRMRPDALQ